jgi:cold shock CspA family protein
MILKLLTFLNRSTKTTRVIFETGTGFVKWYKAEQGQGFLTFDSGPYAGQNIFVHVQEVSKLRVNLMKGARYSFKVNHRRSDGKPFAIELKLLP